MKLLDFGIAKLLDTESTDRAALTAEGMRVLTPDFAAPEQVRGQAITTATDVYALGVLLYLLLTGRHRRADDRRAECARRSTVAPKSLRSGDLDTILGKALQKDPAERYQTVGAFADDITRYLRHEPVSARRTSAAYRIRKLVRRHRGGVAVTAVVCAALIGATVFSVRQMREAEHQRDAAIAAKKRADAQSDLQSLLMSQVGASTDDARNTRPRARGSRATVRRGSRLSFDDARTALCELREARRQRRARGAARTRGVDLGGERESGADRRHSVSSRGYGAIEG